MDEVKEHEGTVVWFDEKRGYGFLSSNDFDTDLYIHYTQIKMTGYRTLMPRQIVMFSAIQSDKGLNAIDVVPKIL